MGNDEALAKVTHQYDWTTQTITVIAYLIRGTLSYNKEHGLKPSSFRHFEGVTHTTVRNYARATIKDPQYFDGNATLLNIIAKKLYKLRGVDDETIYFDPEKIYSGWQEMVADIKEKLGQKKDVAPVLMQISPLHPTGRQLTIEDAQNAMISELMYQFGEMKQELMALRRQMQGQSPTKAPMSMQIALQQWCQSAPPERKSQLGLTTKNWPELKDQIITVMIKDRMVTRDRAEEIIDGSRLEPQEKLLLNYLFAPHDGSVREMDYWDQFSILEIDAVMPAQLVGKTG